MGQLIPTSGPGTRCLYILVLTAPPSSPLSLNCTLYSRTFEKTLLPLHPIGLQGAHVRPPQAQLSRRRTLSFSSPTIQKNRRDNFGAYHHSEPQKKFRAQNAQTGVLWHPAFQTGPKAGAASGVQALITASLISSLTLLPVQTECA